MEDQTEMDLLRSTPHLKTRLLARIVVVASFSCPLAILAQAKDLPLKYSGPPTVAAITAGDLMTRLYIYADDSMRGREVTSPDIVRATAYIESEVRRLGLKPGGETGGYFQPLPLATRALDSTSSLTVDGRAFRAGYDFLVTTQGMPRAMCYSDVIYGGVPLDTLNVLPVDQVRGKFVVLRQFVPPPGFDFSALQQSAGFKAYLEAMRAAAGTISLVDSLPARARQLLFIPSAVTFLRDRELPYNIAITTSVAEAIFGTPVASLTKGVAGKPFSVDIRVVDTPRPSGRNVVAIVPGSDPRLRSQYVVIGAHSDHIGMRQAPQEHDSIKVFNALARPQGPMVARGR